MNSKKGITIALLAFFTLISASLFAQKGKRDFYELRIYHIENASQESQIDGYLEKALLPALHRNGVAKVGVFKPIASQPDAGKKVYLFIPYSSMKVYEKMAEKLVKDQAYQTAGSAYINAPFDNPPYKRIEKAFLLAFTGHPRFTESKVTGPKKDRVYELRSYESQTERLHEQKVKMFNEGEMDIFTKLEFNPVFYGQVISGAYMPNLMYMTTFSNMESRDAHWDKFRTDPDWERMKVMPEYQNIMNKNDQRLLYPTEYSDF
ncbi:NIPSNAP family containing protein [Algoriphagus lacus]|uniref:NIPSNAP family containing protein n=1 Tax=Algoriphagus lacus TaxID=2056311 RepID=A0A418PWF9_9BACT|nr:NIPSNAP family protein [Algoriphagus lacus]RIW18517.1 NIPSNAP family containing protein [Algoriphagus lacus]